MEANEILAVLNSEYNNNFTSAEFHRDGGSISYIVCSNDAKYFLRVIRPELLATARQSLDIHLYLQNQSFAVPTIVFTKDGNPHVKNDIAGKTNLLVLYEYIDGAEPSRDDDERVGELIGRFHEVMKRYPGELKVQDKHFFIGRYVNILDGKNHPKADTYRQLGDKLWEKVRALPRGYCHCDLYPGNIMRDKNGSLYVLDFDTSCSAFPMYDVTLFCNETDYFNYSDEGFEKSAEKLNRFLAGYQSVCRLTKEEIEAFYWFHVIYHFQLQATIVEIYGINCNEDDFEDKQLDWINGWLAKAKRDMGLEI